jgi:hypothetical protein
MEQQTKPATWVLNKGKKENNRVTTIVLAATQAYLGTTSLMSTEQSNQI